MYVPRATRWAKTPTINRYLYGLTLLGLVAMPVVSTGSPQASAVVLTEAQAVQLGLSPRPSPRLPVLAVFFSRGTSGSCSFYRFLISSLAETLPRRSV
jgi:hypothetical protein